MSFYRDLTVRPVSARGGRSFLPLYRSDPPALRTHAWRLDRNFPQSIRLIKKASANFIGKPIPRPDRFFEQGQPGAALSAAERAAIAAARNVYEFDDLFVAPHFGYRDAQDYYESNAAKHFLAGVTRPTLILYALDDPRIPAGQHSQQMQLNARTIRHCHLSLRPTSLDRRDVDFIDAVSSARSRWRTPRGGQLENVPVD